MKAKSICAFCICNGCCRMRGNIRNMWHLNTKAVIERVHWVEKCVRTADNGAVWVKYQ
jgi:hypothetical protein